MKLSIKQIKTIIREELLKEADGYSCNKHSLGFVDDKGKYIDIDKVFWTTTHSGYMAGYLDDRGVKFKSEEDKYEKTNKTPKGWIKISNANDMTFQGSDWSQVTEQQINGLIQMWMACSKHSPWIKKSANDKLLRFASNAGEEKMTLGDFIEKYGTSEQLDKMFNFLMS